MKIRRFTGKDMRDALRLVKEELGADAVIMSNKKTVNGKINFVLLREIGNPFVCNEVTQQAVYETLMQLGAV